LAGAGKDLVCCAATTGFRKGTNGMSTSTATATATATTANGREKHPRGLYVLFGTEMWERFSFYTVGAMLSLYLRDTTDGFGFSNARSASVVSTYNMFIYFTPLIGGLIADRLTGFRKAIMIGGVSFMIGHALLAVPDNLLICYLALTFLVVGNGFFKPNVSSMVGNLYREGSHLKDKAYRFSTWASTSARCWRRWWRTSSARAGASIRRFSWVRSAWCCR
jgi:dipeptide/tripeptide permease